MHNKYVPLLIATSLTLTACGGGGGGSSDPGGIPTESDVPDAALSALHDLAIDVRDNHQFAQLDMTITTTVDMGDGAGAYQVPRYERADRFDYVDIDIGGDGDRDVLVMVTEYSDNVDNIEILGNSYALINDGSGNFTKIQLDIGETGRTYEVKDFNNDGLEDLYMPGHGYEQHGHFGGTQDNYWIQNSDGTFRDETLSAMRIREDFGHGSCSGDFRGDGENDVIVVNMGTGGRDIPSGTELRPEVNYFTNTNNGASFVDESHIRLPREKVSSTHMGPIGISYTWCVVMDHDGDSDLDVILFTETQQSGGFYTGIKTPDGDLINGANNILINNGSGHFTAEYVYLSDVGVDVESYLVDPDGSDSGTVAATFPITMDINNDACEDMIVNLSYTSFSKIRQEFQVWIAKCDGTTGFTLVDSMDGPSHPEFDSSYYMMVKESNTNFTAASFADAKRYSYTLSGGFIEEDSSTIGSFANLGYADFLFATELMFLE